MKVLVTGGSGFIGSYVLRELLAAGYSVSSFSRGIPHIPGADFIPGDILDPERLREACLDQDAVIHLAAVSGPGRATPADMIRINVAGTVNVLEAAVRTGITKVVLASSGAATGFSFPRREIVPHYLPLDEDHPCQPQDEYGLSKLLAERCCQSYSEAFGLSTPCLRINNNWYLKREEAEVAVQTGWAKGMSVEELWTARYRKTVENAPEDLWPIPGPPAPRKVLWAFTDARDAAQAFRLALEDREIVHEVFLISGDDTCSERETPQLLARHYPDVPLRKHLPGYDSLWSHEKATRMLGYQPQYTWRESDFSDWLRQVRRKEG